MSAILMSEPLRHGRVLTSDHSDLFAINTLIHEWNKPSCLLLPIHSASPHFGRYSFAVPQRVGGRVGLGGW